MGGTDDSSLCSSVLAALVFRETSEVAEDRRSGEDTGDCDDRCPGEADKRRLVEVGDGEADDEDRRLAFEGDGGADDDDRRLNFDGDAPADEALRLFCLVTGDGRSTELPRRFLWVRVWMCFNNKKNWKTS